MTHWLQNGVLAVTLAATAGLVLACDSGGGTDPSPTTNIRATVTAEGSGLAGVTVELYASGGTSSLMSRTTDSNGEAVFADVDPGTYELEVAVPTGYALAAGEEDRKTVMVAEGQDRDVSFALEPDAGANVEEVRLTSSLTFSPAELTIEPGTTVRWVNDASIFHTITPDGHSEWSRATMNTAGQTFEHTFDNEGTFPYYCEPHLSQGMTGTITVQAST